MSGDQIFEFLATHIQNDALILISPNFLAEANARLLQKPNLLRKAVTDLEQYPLAPMKVVNIAYAMIKLQFKLQQALISRGFSKKGLID